MGKGARAILIMVAVAAILGILTIFLNKDYRSTAISMLDGNANTAILKSNEKYFAGIAAVDDADEQPDSRGGQNAE